MRSTSLTRTMGTTLALVVLGGSYLAAKPAPGVARPGRPRVLNLFALPVHVMGVNRVSCPITNIGFVCVDSTLSPVLEGAFWPKGTPDSYIFNSGLQIGGFIPDTAGGGKASFPWAGDLVGAFFMDPRGDQYEGDAITNIYSSLDPNDASNWPSGAVVRDASIYHPSLIGRNNISQEDLWVRVWDGNPTRLAGRTHPMGILVEERGLAWNFPTGNQDIIYFVYTFYNVTASDCSVYSGLDPAIQSDVCAVGQKFQQQNGQRFGITFPAKGWSFTNVFAAFFEDCDVGSNAGINYSTPNLVFNMGFCYESPFSDPAWAAAGGFPPSVFSPPQVAAPGFTGTKYLLSPKDSTGTPIGLSMFSNTLNSGTGYPDPRGVAQMYRYISGTSDPATGDNPCTFQGQQKQRHYCFLAQTREDTRFFLSSGPFTLKPGDVKTIVVAYMFAAPDSDVVPFQTVDLKPGIPPSPRGLVTGPDTIRTIDRASGWVSHAVLPGDTVIRQEGVATVPRSLLNKALVAQAVFDKRFLLPSAPVPPSFFLVPGDNQVTVVWQKSPTEASGDPYYAVASKPKNTDGTANTLYDPNFRQFDVEGYRIYRGRTSGDMRLVAQFDYGGAADTIADYTGDFDYGPGCAPELGVQAGCPVTFDANPVVPTSPHVAHPLAGAVVQVSPGGRVKLADGSILLLRGDTAVTGAGFPGLLDTGVPFVYVDKGVRNSFTYFYAVTAFDVNSLSSGPSSLESPLIGKQVTPRKPATNVAAAVFVSGVFGADGTQLDPTAAYPVINATNGTFAANMPPPNDGSLLLTASVLEALPQGDISVRIDSVSNGLAGGIGTGPTFYLTLSAGGLTQKKAISVDGLQPAFSDLAPTGWSFTQPLVPFDSANAKRMGILLTDTSTRMPVAYSAQLIPIGQTSPAVSVAAGRFGNYDGTTQYLAHSRWFAEGGAEPPHPTLAAGPDSSHNAGALPGVSKIWAPQAYRDSNVNVRFRSYSYAQVNWYPADFVVTWNADSSISVSDVTNHSPLPYAPNGGSGWGFVNVAAFTAAGVTAANLRQGGDLQPTNLSNVTYNHFYGVHSVCDQRGIPCITLGNKAQYEALDLKHDGTANANGIALWINGEGFIMAMPAIPAPGTKWHLRAVSGQMTATCTGRGPYTSCTNYSFTGPAVRPSMAPGLTYKITVQAKYTVNAGSGGDLSKVHTVPDPYYVTNALEFSANNKVLKFVNLPSQCIIRIYSTSGILLRVVTHNDQTGGGEATWDLRNRNSQFVASGVYFYHIEAPDGQTKIGRFTVINFAP